MAFSALIVAVPLLLVGAVVLFFVLRFLQRRLHVFTRGTIGFMTFVCVGFALVDLVAFGNELRNDEARLRVESEEAFVGDVVHRIFEPGELVAELKTSDPDLRRRLEEEHRLIEQEIAHLVGDGNLDRYELACFQVERDVLDRFRPRLLAGSVTTWRAEAMMVDVRNLKGRASERYFGGALRCRLRVDVVRDGEGGLHVNRVDGEVETFSPESVDYSWRRSRWRNPMFRPVGPGIGPLAD